LALVMRAVRAAPQEVDALRSLLGRPLDEVIAEDLSWVGPEQRAALEREGYLEVVLRSGEDEVSLHAEEFSTPPPYPRCKLFRPAALPVDSDAYRSWRDALRERATVARNPLDRERIERHLRSGGGAVARELGPVAEVRTLKTLFWPRRTEAGPDAADFEWRFLNPRNEQALALAGAETAKLARDVAITEYDIGIAITTAGGREVVASTEKLVLLALDQGLGRFAAIAAPEPL
jgi:hypothetical protein